MELALNSTELIHLYLKEFIHEPFIRKYIIELKLDMELQDNIKYHSDRWNHIIGTFYYTKDNQSSCSLVFPPSPHTRIHSHIFFSSNTPPQYIIVPDNIKDFYNITNTSYQSWELLFELILKHYTHDPHDLNYDDLLYSKLSLQINTSMKSLINS